MLPLSNNITFYLILITFEINYIAYNKMKKIGIIAGITFFLCSCIQVREKKTLLSETISDSAEIANKITDIKADKIIEKAISAHGGNLYDQAHYSFIFRKKEYSFKNNDASFTYEVNTKDSRGNTARDVIKNGNYTKFINEKIISVSEKDSTRYYAALNSVIYFATIPHKLSDTSVNKSYQGDAIIKGEHYDVIKVFFDKKGGGADHDDIYYYWIHKETSKVDYFAYNYTVNGGGARFRSYYNRRNVSGIIFQDYINWKAQRDIPLDKLPKMFEKGTLKELSRIETEQVKRNQ